MKTFQPGDLVQRAIGAQNPYLLSKNESMHRRAKLDEVFIVISSGVSVTILAHDGVFTASLDTLQLMQD